MALRAVKSFQAMTAVQVTTSPTVAAAVRTVGQAEAVALIAAALSAKEEVPRLTGEPITQFLEGAVNVARSLSVFEACIPTMKKII